MRVQYKGVRSVTKYINAQYSYTRALYPVDLPGRLVYNLNLTTALPCYRYLTFGSLRPVCPGDTLTTGGQAGGQERE